MGKGGRIACIFVPFALTVASFICLILLQLGGWNSSSAELNSLHFFQADFTNLNLNSLNSGLNSATLTVALQLAKSQNAIANIYQIHLWNYCTSSSTSNNEIASCTARQANFVFDPIQVWNLNATADTIASAIPSGVNSTLVQSQIDAIKASAQEWEDQLLGESGRKALDTYRTAAKWIFIGYQVSFWTTLATIVMSLLAICSRWGSFLTWILSVTSTIFTILSVLAATILYSVLVGALKGVLDPYGVSLSIGTKAMAVGWIAVVLSLTATLFWLFSVCCCSGSSNPHHRSNKGGLWSGQKRASPFHSHNESRDSRRGLLGVEKVGGGHGYERVSSPFAGHHDFPHRHHDDYQAPIDQRGHEMQERYYPSTQTVGYEPYRHV